MGGSWLTCLFYDLFPFVAFAKFLWLSSYAGLLVSASDRYLVSWGMSRLSKEQFVAALPCHSSLHISILLKRSGLQSYALAVERAWGAGFWDPWSEMWLIFMGWSLWQASLFFVGQKRVLAREQNRSR